MQRITIQKHFDAHFTYILALACRHMKSLLLHMLARISQFASAHKYTNDKSASNTIRMGVCVGRRRRRRRTSHCPYSLVCTNLCPCSALFIFHCKYKHKLCSYKDFCITISNPLTETTAHVFSAYTNYTNNIRKSLIYIILIFNVHIYYALLFHKKCTIIFSLYTSLSIFNVWYGSYLIGGWYQSPFIPIKNAYNADNGKGVSMRLGRCQSVLHTHIGILKWKEYICLARTSSTYIIPISFCTHTVRYT